MRNDRKLDDLDLAIIAELEDDARLSNTELARRVGLTPAPCLRRVQRLERDGVIAGFGARLDPQRIGLNLQAYVRLQLEHRDRAHVDRFTALVQDWDEVVSCHALTGEMDYLLHVAVADLEHFSRFLLDRVLSTGIVADVNSSFVLRVVKAGHALPLAAART